MAMVFQPPHVYPALIPAARITLPHLAISLFMNAVLNFIRVYLYRMAFQNFSIRL